MRAAIAYSTLARSQGHIKESDCVNTQDPGGTIPKLAKPWSAAWFEV